MFHFCLPLFLEFCTIYWPQKSLLFFLALGWKMSWKQLNAWCHCTRIRTKWLFPWIQTFSSCRHSWGFLVCQLVFVLFSFKFYFPSRVSLWRVTAQARIENFEWLLALCGVWKNQRLGGCQVFFLQVLDILSIQTTLFHAAIGSCYEYFI